MSGGRNTGRPRAKLTAGVGGSSMRKEPKGLGLSAHKVKVSKAGKGSKGWRANCSCGWRSTLNARAEVEASGTRHRHERLGDPFGSGRSG